VRDFCAAFVPLDLSADDAAHFAAGLEADAERCVYTTRAKRAHVGITHTPCAERTRKRASFALILRSFCTHFARIFRFL
jgi:hypothetical protein